MALSRFDFALLVLTADDLTVSRGTERAVARDNVLFELGLFIGFLGRDRTFMLYDRTKAPVLPSDLAGITAATFAPHASGNLEASLGAPSTKIRNVIERLGIRKDKGLRELESAMQESGKLTQTLVNEIARERTARAVALRPHVERAFEQSKISIDFAGFSGQTLHGVIQEPLDKIRTGQLVPESLDIRILIPDTSQPWAVPCRAADLSDEPAFRQRAEQIGRRHTDAIIESVTELADLGLVQTARAQVRTHGTAPLFKLYILNRAEAFFGFYPIVEHTISLGDQQHVPMYDLMGKDVTMFHHEQADDPSSIEGQFVAQAQDWFDSMWTTVSRAHLP
jgi:hypothetical protein